MSDSDSITQAVRTQYEQYPFPPLAVEESPAAPFSPYSSYTLAQYSRINRYRSDKDIRILLAGCGSGHEVQLVAQTNPQAQEIIGIDLSNASIELARQRIRHHGLFNCRVEVGNLLKDESLPEGPFDMIVSYGVLHHTGDPTLALQNLATRLEPEGVMGIMLYNPSGRWLSQRIIQALSLMGIFDRSSEDAVTFIRELLAGANPQSMLANHARLHKEYYKHTTNIVDTFLHPQNLMYSIVEIPDFLSQAKLEFLDVVPEPMSWQPEAVITRANRKFYQIYDSLPRIAQLYVLELLNPTAHPNTSFWCCHQGATSNIEEDFATTTWHLNPLFADHAILKIGDKLIPFSQYCTDPDILTTSQSKVQWRLFCTEKQQIAFTQFQLQKLLLPLSGSPKSGTDILQQHNQSDHDWIQSLFERWEKLCVILRG